MPDTIPVMPETKVIIELDQKGSPLKVYVAEKADGALLKDLTGLGKPNPKHPTNDRTRMAQIEFHAGNCVKIGTVWYCS